MSQRRAGAVIKARAYRRARRAEKVRILDELVDLTGCCRDCPAGSAAGATAGAGADPSAAAAAYRRHRIRKGNPWHTPATETASGPIVYPQRPARVAHANWLT